MLMIQSCAYQSEILGKKQNELACIEGGVANFFRLFTNEEVHVDIQPFPPRMQMPYSRRCVPAGTHSFLVAAARGPGFGTNAIIIITLMGGHSYKVQASYQPYQYQYNFTITDKTTEDKFVVYRFSLPEGYYGMDIFRNKVVRPPLDLTGKQ